MGMMVQSRLTASSDFEQAAQTLRKSGSISDGSVKGEISIPLSTG